MTRKEKFLNIWRIIVTILSAIGTAIGAENML